jgi:hypothetical protein
MHRATTDIPLFYALLPGFIPQTRKFFRTSDRQILDSLFTICIGGNFSVSNSEAAAEIGNVLADMHVMLSPAGTATISVKTVADDAAHDTYFRIARVKGEAPQIFIRSLLQANLVFLEETTEGCTILDEQKLQKLDDAFKSVLAYVLGLPKTPLAKVSAWDCSPVSRADPVRRWIRGHHIFVMLTQALILVFQEMDGALADKREIDVLHAIDLATILMEGSTIALRFAGDFTAIEYRDVVRPSMMPPHAPEGLSGLLSADHRHFIHLLSKFKHGLKEVQVSFEDRYNGFVSAFKAAYDNHKYVCSRFDGSKKPSLLMKVGGDRSAVEELERFKYARMKMFL